MLKKVMWGSRLKYRNFHLEESRLESARSLPKPTVFRRMTSGREKRGLLSMSLAFVGFS